MTIALVAAAGLVVGFLEAALLRGRGYAAATDPARTISWWWCALLPLLGVALFAGLAWRADSLAELILGIVFVAGALIAVWTDLDVFRLPDWVTLPMAGCLALVVLVDAAVTGDWSRGGRALLAASVTGLVFLALAIFSTLGLGDVKLALSIGLLLGYVSWQSLLLGVVAGYVGGALWAAVLLLRGASPKDHFAFGPALIVGALVAFGVHIA